MPLGANLIEIGTTTFTANQYGFFKKGIAQGLSQTRLREVFRSTYNKGFSSATFTAVRQQVVQGRDAANVLSRLPRGNRPAAGRIPSVLGSSVRTGYQYSGAIRLGASPGQPGGGLLPFRFQSEESLTRDQMESRVSEIVNEVNASSQSDLTIQSVELHDLFRIIADPAVTL